MNEIPHRPFLEGDKIYLRKVRITDVNENYYKKHCFYNGKYTDVILMGIINEE